MKTETPNASGRSAWLWDNITKCLSFSIIVTLLVAPSPTQDSFLGTSNLRNLLRDTAPLMIISAGMIMVLLFGSISLSMGTAYSVPNITHIHPMLVFQDSFSNPFLTNLTVMAVSLVFDPAPGPVLGIIHVKLKALPSIASLGFMSPWQLMALPIAQNPESVPKIPWDIVEWCKTAFDTTGLPLTVVIAIILFIYCVIRYTLGGWTIFVIGGNERTARVADMGMDRTKVLVFVVNGALAALAGISLAANFHSSTPAIRDPFTLKIMAACALGDISLAGGKDGELSTILGVSAVVIIENGMNFIGINAYYQNIVSGIFVLAAIILTVNRDIYGQIIEQERRSASYVRHKTVRVGFWPYKRLLYERQG